LYIIAKNTILDNIDSNFYYIEENILIIGNVRGKIVIVTCELYKYYDINYNKQKLSQQKLVSEMEDCY